MVNSHKSLLKINEACQDSSLVIIVLTGKDKVDEFNDIVTYRIAFQSTILPEVYFRANQIKKPVNSIVNSKVIRSRSQLTV